MPRPPRDQFEALVREHHAAVHRSASRWLGADAAADVTQDVFVRVLEGKVRLAAARDVRATLCWLATRLAANAQRARRRRERHEENAMHRTDVDPPVSRATDPATLADAADLQQQVVAAVAALPDELRLPLQLHCQDQLSFAEVGTALRVPASTAHDRVQRALRTLRTALAGRGFAVAAAGLPELVATSPAPAPHGLEQRLLALGDGGLAVGAGFTARLAIGAVAVATTVCVAALAWWGARDHEIPVATTAAVEVAAAPDERSDSQVPGAAPAGAAGVGSRTLVPPRTEPVAVVVAPEAATASVFHGTVRDAAAWPVTDATVEAMAAGGLKPMRLASATTDAAGAFRLELSPHGLAPTAVRLRVVEGGRVLLETAEFPLPRNATAEALALVLPDDVGTAEQTYELAVTIVSAAGMPLSDVDVQVTADAVPRPRPGVGPIEASATSGGDGVAVVRGRGLGAKWLFVDGRAAGFAAAFVPVALDRAGARAQRVVLEAGGELEVHVTRLDDEPLPWASVWLEHDATGLAHSPPTATLGADGRIAFTALGDGSHTLHVSADHTLSPAVRRGLVANGPPVAIRLKRQDDPRDVGDHMAELHGVLVDAATGAVVPWKVFTIDVLPLRDGASTLPSDRLVPRPPAQTMADDYERQFTDFHEVALEPGRHALVANVEGYAQAVFEVVLQDGEVRAGLRVPLQRGGTVHGRVVDATRRPVARASVFPVGVGALADAIVERWRTADLTDVGAASPSAWAGVGYSDADGRFSLADLPPGVEVRLLARTRDGAFTVSAPRVVRAGEVLDGVELVLEPR